MKSVDDKFVGVFKVYKDKAGQYRSQFYIGEELLWTSEGYRDMDTVMTSIHFLRNRALSAGIEIQFPIKEG